MQTNIGEELKRHLLWQAQHVNSKVKHSGKCPKDEDTNIIPARGKEGNLKHSLWRYLIGIFLLPPFLKGETAVSEKEAWVRLMESGLIVKVVVHRFLVELKQTRYLSR